VTFERTTLSPGLFDPAAKALGTAELVDISSSIAFRSIGYKSEALPGFAELGIPFDSRHGIIPNDQFGRVFKKGDLAESGPANHFPGLYCAGWVKRGPSGVIASTMQDAFLTANAISEDWHSQQQFLNSKGEGSGLGWDGVRNEAESRGCRRVTWSDWEKIDKMERQRGKTKGKEREKFTKVQDMLAVLD
jgi:adrenodoxin-NADP+ reductase